MITIQTSAIHASVWLPYRWLLPASQKMDRCCTWFLLPSQEWPKWLFLQVSFWMWPARRVSLTCGTWGFVLLWVSTSCMVFFSTLFPFLSQFDDKIHTDSAFWLWIWHLTHHTFCWAKALWKKNATFLKGMWWVDWHIKHRVVSCLIYH